MCTLLQGLSMHGDSLIFCFPSLSSSYITLSLRPPSPLYPSPSFPPPPSSIYRAASLGLFEVIQVLSAYGANFTMTTSSGENAMHFATTANNLLIVRLLGQRGVPFVCMHAHQVGGGGGGGYCIFDIPHICMIVM